MKSGDGFVQGYNAQAAVEPVLQLIVGQAVTQAANDKEQMTPMMDVIEQQSGQRPEEVLAELLTFKMLSVCKDFFMASMRPRPLVELSQA
jgi:hypothetical protein